MLLQMLRQSIHNPELFRGGAYDLRNYPISYAPDMDNKVAILR